MHLKLYPCGARQWLMALARLTLLTLVVMGSLFNFSIRMPGNSFSGPLPLLTPAERRSAELLSGHVHVLALDIGPRNIWTPSSMPATVDYLEKVLSNMGYVVRRQEFSAGITTSVNLEVEIAGRIRPTEIVVVGAHYDTVMDCPGANDNGSGVAALLELSRLLRNSNPDRTIRLVAFANEEPPLFTSDSMGSSHYARLARERNEAVVAMLSLETIGYFSDKPGSQQYPFPFSLFYPDTANFIAFVGNISSRSLVHQSIAAFRNNGRFPSEGLAAPAFVTGVGWSDHRSFWQQGYPAIMVTDTAFYRYAAYHTAADTPEKLDYVRMARVVGGLAPTILELAETHP